MKLFKYVPMTSALRILESSTIGFSRPQYFNDPFDQPFAIPVPTSDPIKGLFAQVGAEGKSFIWGQNTAVLSLTRMPTSPLMWAHYADAHRGVVIGFDAGAAGFLDEASNMVPAHYGSVIYLRQRNNGPYHSTFGEPVAVGATHHFVLSHYEKWQRLFLSKPIDWAYEEEVRVVKCIGGIKGADCEIQSGVFSVVEVGDRELHAFHIPPQAITDIYLGVRASAADATQLHALRPDLAFHRCCVDPNAYALKLVVVAEQGAAPET